MNFSESRDPQFKYVSIKGFNIWNLFCLIVAFVAYHFFVNHGSTRGALAVDHGPHCGVLHRQLQISVAPPNGSLVSRPHGHSRPLVGITGKSGDCYGFLIEFSSPCQLWAPDPVGVAGPQPWVPDACGHCRTSTASARCQAQRMPDRMSESDKMPNRLPDGLPDRPWNTGRLNSDCVFSHLDYSFLTGSFGAISFGSFGVLTPTVLNHMPPR